MNVIGIKSLNIDVIQFSRQLQKSERKIRTMKTGAVNLCNSILQI